MTKLKMFWQWLYIWVFYSVFTILVISPSLILGFVTRQYWWVALTQKVWGRFLFFGLGQSVSVTGREHLARKKPYLIIANHSSQADIPALAALVETPVSWVIKESLLKVPILRYAFRLGLGIPIPRENARSSQSRILNRVKTVIRRAKTSIIIFPEGTRSFDGSVREFKRGFVRIMKEYDLDLLPVTLSGFHSYLPPRKMFPHPEVKLHVKIHPPVPAASLENLSEQDICSRMRSLIGEALL